VRRYSESAVRASHLGFMRSSVMPISRTSIWAASARASGAREPDSNVRNPDWLAAEFLGPEERALLAGHPLITSLGQTYDEATQNMEVMGAARMLIVRTRFIDDRFQAALNAGIRQFVIMGAGFDTRAYRLRISYGTPASLRLTSGKSRR
jgi:methyltransferase (TIGR00027 family)